MMVFQLITVILFIEYVLGHDGPTIEVPQGTIGGEYRTSYGGKIYSAFEGIPYAVPPVGDLRFAEPKPAGKWDGVLVANKTYMCMCILLIFVTENPLEGTEDCLYAYVYVPRRELSGDENLDVVVHIHGGAFMMGAPTFMAGPDYLMDKDVVYVTFNYRLAVLGFLSTEDDTVSGNNGLKDQSLALRWIKDNIKYFGGNPDSVTLTGLSAGGASVHFHYLSPLSKGLFHRGFSQSGTTLLPWVLTEHPLKKAKTIANSHHCPINSTKTMVDCLRKVKAEDLVSSMRQVFVFTEFVPLTLFGPVVEKGSQPFLPEHPYKLLQEGKIYDVPWVTSTVEDEGIIHSAVIAGANKLEELDSNWNEVMPFVLDIHDTVEPDEMNDVLTKVREFYLGDEHLTAENDYPLVRLLGDRTFVVDSEKALRLHARAVKSPVYYYFFTYHLQQPSFLPGYKGVSHADDTKLSFKAMGTPEKLEADDEKMMQLFTEFITNFAKSSNPSFANVDWQAVDSQSESINALKIASPNDISMGTIDELAPSEFWKSLPIMENEKLFHSK